MRGLDVATSPSVAIVIAAYNAADMIAVAVCSALQQPEASEVWVIDDASTDETARAARSCDDGTGRLNVISLVSNAGPGAARNIALDGTSAEWICVLDADDRFSSGRLAALLAKAQSAEMVADAIVRVSDINEDPSEGRATSDLETTSWNQINLADFVEGNVSRKGRLREELGFIKPIMSVEFLRRHAIRYRPELRLGEDFLIYSEALAHGGRLLLGPPCGYLALTRPDSLSGRHTIGDLQALRDSTCCLQSIRSLDEAERKAIRRHWRSVDDRLQWRRLIEAVKARDFRAGLATFHDIPASRSLIEKLVDQVWLRSRRLLKSGGGSDRAQTAP